MATTVTTTASPVPDLVALKNEAAAKNAAIVNSEEWKTKLAEQQRLSEISSETSKAYVAASAGSPEEAALKIKNDEALKAYQQSVEAVLPLAKAAHAAKAEYQTYDAQLEAVGLLGTGPMAPAKVVAETQAAATVAGAEAAKTTTPTTISNTPESPSPPTQVPVTQTNIDNTNNTEVSPEQTGAPVSTAAVAEPTQTNTTVLTDAQQTALDNYNASRVENGLNPLAANDPRVITDLAGINDRVNEINNPTSTTVDSGSDPALINSLANEYGNQSSTIVDANTDQALINSLANEYGGGSAPPVVPISTVVDPSTITQLPEITIPQPAGTDFMIDVTGQTNAAVTGFINSKLQKTANSKGVKDWRFRMSLAPSANYMYKDRNPGILLPLAATNGVIFPYSPQISVSYTANYTNYDLTHSNFKIHTYKNSSIENITITGDFTAQDTAEANYLLAVMHFFKTVTKMFYGQDQNPQRGIPPPLVYLSGFGQYQFDMHPVVITSYTHTFPTDVDYISSYPTNNSNAIGGQNMQPYAQQITSWLSPLDRLRQLSSSIQPGGLPPPPKFSSNQNINEATRVPTKVQIQLNCLPVVTRNVISNNFSLKRYATGELMKGSTNGLGGGVW